MKIAQVTIGCVMIVAGFVLRFMGALYLKGNYTPIPYRPTMVIKAGPYGIVRHPMYTGSIMVLVGCYLLLPVLGYSYLTYTFFVSRAFMEDTHGDVDYLNKVGRFIPNWRQIKTWLHL
jgi:protein-S-isoprenylcysteine O-methyltransferase Ste14